MSKIIRYASYLVNDEEIYGTAELVNGSGYAFRKDGERRATLVSYKEGCDNLWNEKLREGMWKETDVSLFGGSSTANRGPRTIAR
jgi:hypothetical protein